MQKEQARIDRQIKKRPVSRQSISNLKLVSIRIPETLLEQIDKASINSPDSRNRVIHKVLQQYFNAELTRTDDTALDYSNSIKLGRSNGQATIGINILNPCIRSETMSQSNGKKRELAVIAAKAPARYRCPPRPRRWQIVGYSKHCHSLDP